MNWPGPFHRGTIGKCWRVVDAHKHPAFWRVTPVITENRKNKPTANIVSSGPKSAKEDAVRIAKTNPLAASRMNPKSKKQSHFVLRNVEVSSKLSLST
jgi:hypothetical protein